MPSRLPRLLFSIFISLFIFTSVSQAQYFGQNKVRYKKLDFKVVKTDHFDIYYYPEEAGMAPEIGRMAERWYARLSRIFDHQLSSRQPVIVYASAPDFRSTTVIPEDLGESTGGVTEPLRRRVVMPLTGSLAETDHVLGHELVHAFQYDISMPAKYGAGLGQSGMERLPLWFIEGMAEYLSLGPVDPNTTMWMRDAVSQNKVPKIKDLWNPKYFPYRWGQSLWAFIEGTYGERMISEMQRSGGRSGNANSTIKSVLGITPDELTRRWQAALRRQYEPILESTTNPSQQGKLLISKKQHGGGSELNVSPALSPDGKQMVFFSEKDLFSIDLYLADAETGQIKRKLTKTALNPHLDSLEFINSAGAWSLDGKRFALGEIVDGRPQLAVYDVASAKTVERIKLPQMGEIYNPTWSPDGKQVAFSALINGMSDLFIADLATKKLRRMTNDEFADLQPAWSPDGASIAFVTDRFSTQTSDLAYGKLQLALLNVNSGAIEPMAAFPNGNHINPQWSPDGKSIYFVSDRDGIPNIYRLARADGSLYQLTNIQTGISGITHLSPTFSVAAREGRLVYSAFVDRDYDIYSLDSPAALAGEKPTSILQARQAASLPPMGANAQQLLALITDPNVGAVSAQNFQVTNYKPKLSLDYLAPPSFGVGYSNFGGLVSGGTGLYFSDLLNTRSLVLAVQSGTFGGIGNSFWRNIAGVAAYENQKSRWTWGFVGGQVPFVTGAASVSSGSINGVPVLQEQDIIFWQINRQIAAIASYPFNRAQRVEFSGGFTNVSFAATADTSVFSGIDGSLLAQQQQDLPTFPALNLATTSAALVYDTSIFGGTSPVLGQSYRLELDGAGGTLNYTTLLADYRKYLRITRPLSLAGRVLHYGRYGGDADDQRLQDLFIGYGDLVRGYNPGSFSVNECGPNAAITGTCPVLDQLVGSKVAVANAEARLELLGPLGVIPSKPIPPVEAAWFYDAGAAWTGFDKAGFLGGNRKGVSSYGASLRFNILGFAVGQLSYAHPNDRPLKNWVWQFDLVPGW